MNNYKEFSDDSKVWIYQSNRVLDEDDVNEIRQKIGNFTKNWTSHDNSLKAAGDIFYNRFIVFFVDEKLTGASGCSIDKSVHFMKAMEIEFSTQFFDRMTFAYLKDEKVHTVHKVEMTDLFTKGIINDETIFFDNLVKNKQDFQQHWLKPLKESWHRNMISRVNVK